MARGKHEAQALRSRYEALLAVVDDLTEKNAELKVRTRKVEAEAAAAPGLRLRVTELEQQVQTSETPALDALRVQHAEKVAGLEALIRSIVEWFNEEYAERRLTTILPPKFEHQLRKQYGLVQLGRNMHNRRRRRLVANHQNPWGHGEEAGLSLIAEHARQSRAACSTCQLLGTDCLVCAASSEVAQ